MASITLQSNSNYVYSQGLNENPPEKLHIEPRPTLGQGATGLFNLYYVPLDVYYSLQDQIQAEAARDKEGSQENWLKITAAFFNIITSAYSGLDTVSKILIYFQAIKPNCLSFMPKISKKLPFIGLIVCTIESTIDMRGLKHAYSMLEHVHLTRSDKELLRDVKWLNQEFGTRNSVTDKARERSLIRRVYPDCAKKVQKMVPLLIEQYGSINPQEWRKLAVDLLKDVKIQSQKKFLMHSIGMIASAITIAGLVAGMCLCPYATVLSLIIIGGIFSTMRYGINEGMMHMHGWKFDPGHLIPDYVKKIFTRCVAQDNCDKEVLSRAL